MPFIMPPLPPPLFPLKPQQFVLAALIFFNYGIHIEVILFHFALFFSLIFF